MAEQDWQIVKSKLSEQNEYILDHNLWTDCTFIVHLSIVGQEGHEIEKEFHCHKLLLSKASPVFESMFYGRLAEKEAIHITDIEPQTFKQLIRYIYTNDTDKFEDYNSTLELCYAARKYLLQALVDQCVIFLWDELTPDNVCQAYEFACSMNAKNMKIRCLKAFEMMTDDIIETESFLRTEQSTLIEILKQNILMINSENQLIEATYKWAKFQLDKLSREINTENLRQVLGKSFLYLRFLSLSLKEFADIPLVSELLTDREKVEIMSNINLENGFTIESTNNELISSRLPRQKPNLQISFMDTKTEQFNFNNKYECILEFSVSHSISLIGIETLIHHHHYSSPSICERIIYVQNLNTYETCGVIKINNTIQKLEIIKFDKAINILNHIIYRIVYKSLYTYSMNTLTMNDTELSDIDSLKLLRYKGKNFNVIYKAKI